MIAPPPIMTPLRTPCCRTFLTLLPAQRHLDLRFFLSRFDVGQGEGLGLE